MCEMAVKILVKQLSSWLETKYRVTLPIVAKLGSHIVFNVMDNVILQLFLNNSSSRKVNLGQYNQSIENIIKVEEIVKTNKKLRRGIQDKNLKAQRKEKKLTISKLETRCKSFYHQHHLFKTSLDITYHSRLFPIYHFAIAICFTNKYRHRTSILQPEKVKTKLYKVGSNKTFMLKNVEVQDLTIVCSCECSHHHDNIWQISW